MPHLFPGAADYLPAYPICLVVHYPATKNQVGRLYQLLGVRSERLTHLSAVGIGPAVQLVPQVLQVAIQPATRPRSQCRRGCRARRPRSRSRPKARIASIRITTPATIVGARSGWRPGISTRSGRGPRRAARACAGSRGAERTWPWTRAGSYGSSPISTAASEVGVPATAMPARPSLGPVADRGLDQAADVGGERLQLDGGGRVAGDVALGVADDARLQGGVEGDLGRRCRRSARSSRRRCRSPASARLGGRSEVAPR